MKIVKGYVSGRVQGVSFRYWTQQHALNEGLQGYAKNLADGRVEFVLQGDEQAISRVLKKIRQGPPAARVDTVTLVDMLSQRLFEGFITA